MGWFGEKHEEREKASVGGHVILTVAGSRLQVSAPYNEEWIREAKRLSGRYRYRSKRWSFPLTNEVQVLKTLRRIFEDQAITKNRG